MTAAANTGDRPGQDDPDGEAKALFRRAVASLPDGANRREPAGLAERANRLSESAALVAAAFRAAPGQPSGTEAPDEATGALLRELQSAGAADGAGPDADRIADLERRYRAALPALRTALAARLARYDGAAGAFRNTVASAPARWSAAVLAAAAILLVTAHRLVAPEYVMTVDGQVFWKPSPSDAFAEERSRHFEVTVDGAAHEYVIDLEPPAEIAVLRLDPADRGEVSDIEILHLALVSAGQAGRVEFDIDEGWTCANCRWIKPSSDSARLKPVNDDPYIVGPAGTPARAAAVRVTMRASAPKTLWQWMTGLEKTN